MSENTQVSQSNPFGQHQLAAGSNALASTDAAKGVAEIQAAMLVAQQFPRNQARAYDVIMNACQRPALAESAMYSYARGGQEITGPSIRLAEALAMNWGNIKFGVREISAKDGVSTVQAFAWDMETNVQREMVFQVSHERHTRQGAKRLTDPRDIYELVANQGARRLRACILSVIPGDIVESAVDQCEKTLTAKADTSPAGVEKLVKAFAEFSVTKQMIEKRIQRRLDSITPANMVSLRKVYSSLRDGMAKVDEFFEMAPDFSAPAPASKTETQGAAT